MAVEYKIKRRYPRYPCDTGVKIVPQMGCKSFWGTLSDICYGGCYIFMPTPLPIGQVLTLSIKTADLDLKVAGRTVSSHPGVGMGVAFQTFPRDGEEKLKALLNHLAAQPRISHAPAMFH